MEVTGVRNVSVVKHVKVAKHLSVIPPGLNMRPPRDMVPEDFVRTTSGKWKRALMQSGSGKVEMRICLPGYKDQPFPMREQVPFAVTLTTFSVPTYPTVDPSIDKEALFPSFIPGSLRCALRLRLKRHARIRANADLFGTLEEEVNNPDVAILSDMNKRETLHVDVGTKEWVAYDGPEKKLRGKGSWKQTCVFHLYLCKVRTTRHDSSRLDFLIVC